MADEPVIAPVAPAPANPTMGNDPAARTPEGTIKDVQATPASTDPAAKTEPAKTKPAKAAEPGVVPDKYELKAPEGATLDQALVDKVTPLFKELGVSAEGAQKLFDFHNNAMKAATEGPANAMAEMRSEWRGEVVKDATIGNGVDNLKPEVAANIAKAFGAMDPKVATSMKEAFDLTGAGDNPAVIRGLNALGKLLSEGTLVNGGRPSPLGQTKSGEAARPSPAQAMYPSLPSSAN